jgi:Zn-finger nucleic acid-binding protein
MVTLKRQCPKDGTWMNQIRYETQMLDQCTVCGGTWCDGNEFEQILMSREKKFTDAEIKTAKYLDKMPRLQLERARVLQCVVCKQDLVTRNVKGVEKITIDVCPKGHGTWLDHGELERIQILVEDAESTKNAGKRPEESTHFSEALKIAKATIIPAKPRGSKG